MSWDVCRGARRPPLAGMTSPPRLPRRCAHFPSHPTRLETGQLADMDTACGGDSDTDQRTVGRLQSTGWYDEPAPAAPAYQAPAASYSAPPSPRPESPIRGAGDRRRAKLANMINPGGAPPPSPASYSAPAYTPPASVRSFHPIAARPVCLATRRNWACHASPSPSRDSPGSGP